MGALDEIGWPTLPEVYYPAVEGGGGHPSTYSTRLSPPLLPVALHRYSQLQLSAAVAAHGSHASGVLPLA